MHPKLPLFPKTASITNNGQLTINSQPATDLVRQFGTPLYVYDLETIRDQIGAYRRGLAVYPGRTWLTYASKAFLCTALARLMTGEGVGLDVSSAGEIFIARQGGAHPIDMHMHGNNKTRTDLELALHNGVSQIVADNPTELEALARLATEQEHHANVWLRVTPDVAVETHHRYTVTGTADSKFGFPIDQVESIAADLITAGEPLHLTGLHVHLGSHFRDFEPVAVAVERLLDIAQSLHEQFQAWTLQDLCPGGGWGVRYTPDDPPMPVEPFVKGLVGAVEAGCRGRGITLPRLVLEPGRSLVAQAGVALYKVGARKVIPGVRTYVSIDGGLADNPRPALYQARYTALLANRANEPETETVAIAGPYCESGDVLIQQVDLPPARPGDILAIPVAGAYQLSMSSNYNAALRPAVVFIEGNEATLVQQRETFEDLVKRDVK